MNLSVGIVGLPNVGKSTLFNALLKKQAAFVANYPFATIEPNVGVVPVPDERLEKLAEVIAGISTSEESDVVAREMLKPSNSAGRQVQHDNEKKPSIIPAVVNFVDIAGLVKGASEGAGLGNKFLSHIREVSIICHVVRAFTDENIIKEGSVDPLNDYRTIQTELVLADLSTIQNSKFKVQNGSSKFKVLSKVEENLNNGVSVRDIDISEEEKEEVKELFLLTAKPELIVLNVAEEDYSEQKFPEIYSRYTSISVVERMVVVCAKIEAELSGLSDEEQKEYLKELGVKESGLERLIKKAYVTLGLISFLTAPASAEASARQGGKFEVRAWTIEKGDTAVLASGAIHTDFMKKFIKAEVVSFEDFVQFGGWKGARENGKARLEGKDYVMQDGDVVEFKIGA